MKTGDKIFLMGEYVDEHQCDNCEEILDGIESFYWEEKDFTLCLICVVSLNGQDVSNDNNGVVVKKSIKTIIPKSLRWKVWNRDNFTCQYCETREFLEIDHIYPESKGGTMEESNLVTACKSCNSKKGARTPKEAAMKLVNDPRLLD